MRALEPVETGTLQSRGFTIGFEVFGDPTGTPLLLLPTWQIAHMRFWKAVVPYFARIGFRVVAYDSAGNGMGQRTLDRRAFEHDRVVDQGIDVLDHLGIAAANVIGHSLGSLYAINMAARHPDRVTSLVLVGNNFEPTDPAPADLKALVESFEEVRAIDPSGPIFNRHYWLSSWDEFVRVFSGRIMPEAHMTKPHEDLFEWAHETSPDILVNTVRDPALLSSMAPSEQLRRVHCPVLLIIGEHDQRLASTEHLAVLRPDFKMIKFEGVGHNVYAREPVRFNLEVARFLGAPSANRWRRAALRKPKRALFVSSPIGLGHALRDAAIADELRALVPGIEIDWLAQSPVTDVLAARGERIHPLSAKLAGESKHLESEMSGEHDLRVFQAYRKMDEILVANFMVFHDAVRDGDYDLWVGDEAWDVDHFLHENPELRTSPFAWLTDFVGFLPAPKEDAREIALTADYNAEMIEHVERFGRVRDTAIFVGNPEDIVDEQFGPALPAIRSWTEAHYAFSGYIRYFDPERYDRGALRERFGFAPDECIALATVGGTAVGASLLRRVIDAYPHAKRLAPELRLVVVCGPRIDPRSLPQHAGIEYRAYVHNLHEMIAAVDVGLVQGGLSTTMEFVGAQRPFLYFPLQHHFEQERHVPRRLANYGVSPDARMDYACATPDEIARRLVAALGSRPRYREIEAGGARRVAERLAALVA